MAVEIISESSRISDTVVKRRLCIEQGVAYYLLVDLDARTIESITARSVEMYQAQDTFTISLTNCQAVCIDCGKLFDQPN